MSPFQHATPDPSSVERTRTGLIEKALANPDWRRQTMPDLPAEAGRAEIERLVDDIIQKVRQEESVFMNDTYQVSVRKAPEVPGGPPMVHLSIKRIDRQPIHDWRELQEIKNALVGEDAEAVELYPAEDRLVDSANQYHLWCLPPGSRFPIGFLHRMVDYESVAGCVQRPRSP